MNEEAKKAIESYRIALEQANTQTNLANEEITRQEKMNEELMASIERTFIGTVSVVHEAVNSIFNNLKDTGEKKDLWLYLGEVFAFREMMVGFTRVHLVIHSGTYTTDSDFTKLSTIVARKIDLTVQMIEAKLEKLFGENSGIDTSPEQQDTSKAQ